MDVRAVCEAAEGAARKSEPEAAHRVLIVYIAPGDGGLHIFRPGCGLHQLGGGDGESDFALSMRRCIEQIWPESSPKTRQYLRIAADWIARSPIARMLGGGADDDEDDD